PGPAERVEVGVDDEQAALGALAGQGREVVEHVVGLAVRRVAVPDEGPGSVVPAALDHPRAALAWALVRHFVGVLEPLVEAVEVAPLHEVELGGGAGARVDDPPGPGRLARDPRADRRGPAVGAALDVVGEGRLATAGDREVVGEPATLGER